MSKLIEYVGYFNVLKEQIREQWSKLVSKIEGREREGGGGNNQSENSFHGKIKEKFGSIFGVSGQSKEKDLSHLSRPKTRKELVQISASVMGIEFAYAAETAFVSPLLLSLGVRHHHMTMIWCLSPILGLFISPIMGSLSDSFRSSFGKRRPFIFLFSIGIILGLLLVPNGKYFGILLFGDTYPEKTNLNLYSSDFESNQTSTENNENEFYSKDSSVRYHPWGLLLTIIGTVLLDFNADSCQSPSRSYLLEITLAEDHAKGLSTFTIMAGLGGSFGYLLGSFNWENNLIGRYFGHIRAVFTMVLCIFIVAVWVTLTSFSEIPTNRIWKGGGNDEEKSKINPSSSADENEEEKDLNAETSGRNYGSFSESMMETQSHLTYDTIKNENNSSSENIIKNDLVETTMEIKAQPTFGEYLKTILQVPAAIKFLCLTNFFSWLSLLCYSLYFTDFVGEAVFKGDPTDKEDSDSRKNYEEGVRFGCLGMCFYSLSCSIYSLSIDKLITRFGPKSVYMSGHLCYSFGMFLLSLFRNKVAVIIFSWTAGIMYATLFTLPYLLVARYHQTGIFDFQVQLDQTEIELENSPKREDHKRGLGTDMALVSSMVFLAQIIQALILGNLVTAFGTTTSIICSASVFAFLGAISATRILYI